MPLQARRWAAASELPYLRYKLMDRFSARSTSSYAQPRVQLLRLLQSFFGFRVSERSESHLFCHGDTSPPERGEPWRAVGFSRRGAWTRSGLAFAATIGTAAPAYTPWSMVSHYYIRTSFRLNFSRRSKPGFFSHQFLPIMITKKWIWRTR